MPDRELPPHLQRAKEAIVTHLRRQDGGVATRTALGIVADTATGSIVTDDELDLVLREARTIEHHMITYTLRP
jgi:hypothetical protein